jgi:hypothetical protein
MPVLHLALRGGRTRAGIAFLCKKKELPGGELFLKQLSNGKPLGGRYFADGLEDAGSDLVRISL